MLTRWPHSLLLFGQPPSPPLPQTLSAGFLSAATTTIRDDNDTSTTTTTTWVPQNNPQCWHNRFSCANTVTKHNKLSTRAFTNVARNRLIQNCWPLCNRKYTRQRNAAVRNFPWTHTHTTRRFNPRWQTLALNEWKLVLSLRAHIFSYQKHRQRTRLMANTLPSLKSLNGYKARTRTQNARRIDLSGVCYGCCCWSMANM